MGMARFFLVYVSTFRGDCVTIKCKRNVVVLNQIIFKISFPITILHNKIVFRDNFVQVCFAEFASMMSHKTTTDMSDVSL